MRRLRHKRLKRNIVLFMKREKEITRSSQKYRQRWDCILEGWRRNVRIRMIVKADAFKLRRRKNDGRK